jgi:outer membrane lipoprotein LolB
MNRNLSMTQLSTIKVPTFNISFNSHLPHLILIIPVFGALTACQTMHPPKLPNMPTTTLQTAITDASVAVPPPIRFSITGKIGVRTPKQTGSAFYAWSQEGERFAIDLTGALGIGQTHIEGIPNHVSLQSAKTGFIEASTPEELLQRATGWQAPISYLPHWINGEPVNLTSSVTHDLQHRLLTLDEGGWNVTFYYNDQSDSKYPNRLIMNQIAEPKPESATATVPNNRVILTIQREADAINEQSTQPITTTGTAP